MLFSISLLILLKQRTMFNDVFYLLSNIVQLCMSDYDGVEEALLHNQFEKYLCFERVQVVSFSSLTE